MILESLRERTRGHHERLEARLDIFKLASEPERYRAYLGRLYGFYRPVEAALRGAGFAQGWWNQGAYPPSVWQKTPRLVRDLMALGTAAAEIEGLPVCAELPRLHSQAEALGCLYVLEGATLGGQIISRHLKETLQISPECGGAFFQGYGAETGRMWKTFRGLLTADVESGLCDAEAVIASANETFLRYEAWAVDNRTSE